MFSPRRSTARLVSGLLVGGLCLAPLLLVWVDAADHRGHPYGLWSLLPPLVSILSVMIYRRVLLGLGLGILVGAVIIAGGNPWTGFPRALEIHLWGAIRDEDHLRMFSFTLLMGALVGLLNRSGSMLGLVNLVLPLTKSRRGAQAVSWFLGLLIFFDDYANTIVLGNTLRPVTDRLRISRAKLAFIVDATAAAVASVAVVSTWIVLEVSLIQEALDHAGLTGSGYGVFFETIPYRFYVVWMLAFVGLVAFSGRDFGPMLAAEQVAQQQAAAAARRVTAMQISDLRAKEGVPQRWYNAVLSIGLMIAMFFGLLIWTGWQSLSSAAGAEYSVRNLLGHADSYLALMYASLGGLVAGALLVCSQRLLSSAEMSEAASAGARSMLPGLMVLALAWALADVVQQLQAGSYLAGFLEGDRLPFFRREFLPTLVFLLAGAVSFATGTSFGTMAIMVPMAVAVSVTLLGEGTAVDASDPLLLATVGSVLAGAVFGDHCSPISDTTVLSSQASGCDHLEHVATQMPYALVVAATAVLAGTLPAGWGVPGWLLTLAGLPLLTAVIYLCGRCVEAAPNTER